MSIPMAQSLPARPLVLVADDEECMRRIITRVITQLGLRVLAVSDGAAAIEAATAHRAELICAVLDVRMPIVNGADAAHAIQRSAPDLAIVLMSGAIPADCAGRITQLRLAGMLAKPFPLAVLRQLLLQIVGNSATCYQHDAKRSVLP